MQAQYINRWNNALLPNSAISERWTEWIGRRDETNAKVTSLMNDEEFGWVLQKWAPSLLSWNMDAPRVGNFTLVSPENFLQYPSIIVPPGGIDITVGMDRKWYTEEIQAILELIIRRNTMGTIKPCLSALVHKERIAQWVGKSLMRAWYVDIWEKWTCRVFVHNTTQDTQSLVWKVIWHK